MVSIIVPARDEARNIGECLRSILTTTYPRAEVIVVDDHSTDGTGDIARTIAATDPRVRVLSPPPLPDGWFGKPWACASGAREAHGDILVFTDADTRHAPDLMTRSLNAMRSRQADLFSVLGKQDMHTFWEKLIQPQVFGILMSRYGGTEHIQDSHRPEDKIANGQFIMTTRTAYDSTGGHEPVRGHVAEDLMIAQHYFRSGRRVSVALGMSQLSTRMYASLGEARRGWGKNVYAGGRHSMPGGRLGQFFVPGLMLAPSMFMLVPPLAILLGAFGLVSPDIATAGWIATVLWAAIWAVVYWLADESPAYAVLFPLGSLVLLGVFGGAVMRGSKVEWKGRAYVSE